MSFTPGNMKSQCKTNTPLISVIVAVYNGRDTLQQCIECFTCQTYLHKELIVIDGGSTDGTVELLKTYQNSFSYWVTEPDHGIYNAWNKGLAQAKGDWICFLGADDYFWDEQVLERIASQLRMLPTYIRVAYGKVMRLSTDGQMNGIEGAPWPQVKKLYRDFQSIPHPGTMHRKSLFEQHGNFDESFRIAADYELLLRELLTADAVHIPNIISVGVRDGGVSSLAEYRLQSLRERLRARRLHGLFFPGRSTLKILIKEYARILLWKVLGDRLAGKVFHLRRRA